MTQNITRQHNKNSHTFTDNSAKYHLKRVLNDNIRERPMLTPWCQCSLIPLHLCHSSISYRSKLSELHVPLVLKSPEY